MLHEGCPGERLTQPGLAMRLALGWPRFPVVHHLRPRPSQRDQAMYRQSRGKIRLYGTGGLWRQCQLLRSMRCWRRSTGRWRIGQSLGRGVFSHTRWSHCRCGRLHQRGLRQRRGHSNLAT